MQKLNLYSFTIDKLNYYVIPVPYTLVISVSPSVCVFVTSQYCAKMSKHRDNTNSQRSRSW